MINIKKYTSFIVQTTVILISFNTFLDNNGLGIQFPLVLFILAIPSLWNMYFWKLPFSSIFSKIIGIEDYPNLNGKWKGVLNSSYFYDKKENVDRKDMDCEMNIKQTPAYIEVDCKFGQSESKSWYAQLIRRDLHSNEWYLIYVYNNTPRESKLQASPHGGNHKGFCLLELKENILEGFYSNDEVRKTRGKIRVEKV